MYAYACIAIAMCTKTFMQNTFYIATYISTAMLSYTRSFLMKRPIEQWIDVVEIHNQ